MDAECTAAAITEDGVEVPDTSGSLGMVEDSESSAKPGNDINAVHTASLLDLQGGEATEELVISSMAMETLTCATGHGDNTVDELSAMLDSGANVNVAPVWLAVRLGLTVVPCTTRSQIGTAK